MAGKKAVAMLLVMLLAHAMPTAALRKLQASTGADVLQRQAPNAPATYIIGGGYRDPSGRAATSCGAGGWQPITSLKECRHAAEQVGIKIQTMSGPERWPHVPYGCSVLQGGGKVHFSTTNGSNNGRRGGYVLICKIKRPVDNRIAVFSAQFGGRDRIQYKISHAMKGEMDTEDESSNPWLEESYQNRVESELFPRGVDAFLFTDMVKVARKRSSPWHFVHPARQYEELCDDNVLCLWKDSKNLTPVQKRTQHILQSKFYKMRWIAENTKYDYIVWMDGKYVLANSNLTQTIDYYMGENVDMLAMEHPERQTVAQELEPAGRRAARILHDASVIQKARDMYEQYKLEGFSDTSGLFDSAMFIVRPARVRDMFLDWWHQVQLGVPRDQLSLPWMMQKHRINVRRLEGGACAILGENCTNRGRHRGNR